LKASILSPLPSPQLELVLLELPPGKASWAKARSHQGQECHLVLQGVIRAYYGEKVYRLEEGATILWDGTVPHRMENIGDTDAQLLIALMPPAFLSHEHSEDAPASDRNPVGQRRAVRVGADKPGESWQELQERGRCSSAIAGLSWRRAVNPLSIAGTAKRFLGPRKRACRRWTRGERLSMDAPTAAWPYTYHGRCVALSNSVAFWTPWAGNIGRYIAG
jgi:quercetin dioxygenase-like cupin family protein